MNSADGHVRAGKGEGPGTLPGTVGWTLLWVQGRHCRCLTMGLTCSDLSVGKDADCACRKNQLVEAESVARSCCKRPKGESGKRVV